MSLERGVMMQRGQIGWELGSKTRNMCSIVGGLLVDEYNARRRLGDYVRIWCFVG